MNPQAAPRSTRPVAHGWKDPHAFSRVSLQMDHHTLHRFEALSVLSPDMDPESLWRDVLETGLGILLRERLTDTAPRA